MRRIFTISLMFWTGLLLAQQNQSDLEKAEQLEREKLMKRREAMMKRFEADPERFQDSVRRIRFKAKEEEASRRMERYQANERKDTIQVLDLSFGGFESVPKFVFECDSLNRLILDHNQIDKLPRKLKKMSSLETIQWNENSSGKKKIVRGLPVKRLEIKGNQLTTCPSIFKMKQLSFLDMSENQLTDLPVKKLGKAKQLSEVLIKNNPIGAVTEKKFERWVSVSILKLNKCDINSIDPSFYSIPNLQELQLQENPLSFIPEGISQMRKLSKVSFYKCSLKELPLDFFDIPDLLIADLYYNELSSLPTSLGNADKVEVLFLSHNKIYELPEEVGMLSSLEELYLHNNRISYLPQSLDHLAQLRVLRVNGNLLQTFPDQITTLRNLTDLDIDDNLIENVPKEIGQLDKLKLFTFDGNPINFRDKANQPFMEEVVKMQERGAICKPAIQMDYVDESGSLIDLEN